MRSLSMFASSLLVLCSLEALTELSVFVYGGALTVRVRHGQEFLRGDKTCAHLLFVFASGKISTHAEAKLRVE